MTLPPRVSIVMPCHNGVAHLPRSIASVEAQRFEDWELIVVDDGSTDGSADWLAQHGDARVTVISQTQQGVSSARNRGLRSCRGEFVTFLDADDTWSADFLAMMVQALDQTPAAALAYCGWQNLGLPGPAGEPFIPPDYETSDKALRLFQGCRWPIHAALVRRAALGAGFETDLTHAEDFLLWLTLGAKLPLIQVPHVLVQYHFHGGVQASRNHVRAALQLFEAQGRHLARAPDFVHRWGRTTLHRVMLQGLRQRAFERYWQGDLGAARPLFRKLMREGYGPWREWRYLLPSLLPLPLHQGLRRLGTLFRSPRARTHD